MQVEEIRRRKAGLDLALALLDLADPAALDPLTAQVFWHKLREAANQHLPPSASPPAAPRPDPMSDVQARAFGQVKMPFGKHCGETIDSLPLDYLLQLTEDNPFIRRLKSYLAIRRVQAEQPDPEGAEA